METPEGLDYEITAAWANGNESISVGLGGGDVMTLRIKEAAKLSVMLQAAVQEAMESLKADVDEILSGGEPE